MDIIGKWKVKEFHIPTPRRHAGFHAGNAAG